MGLLQKIKSTARWLISCWCLFAVQIKDLKGIDDCDRWGRRTDDEACRREADAGFKPVPFGRDPPCARLSRQVPTWTGNRRARTPPKNPKNPTQALWLQQRRKTNYCSTKIFSVYVVSRPTTARLKPFTESGAAGFVCWNCRRIACLLACFFSKCLPPLEQDSISYEIWLHANQTPAKRWLAEEPISDIRGFNIRCHLWG